MPNSVALEVETADNSSIQQDGKTYSYSVDVVNHNHSGEIEDQMVDLMIYEFDLQKYDLLRFNNAVIANLSTEGDFEFFGITLYLFENKSGLQEVIANIHNDFIWNFKYDIRAAFANLSIYSYETDINSRTMSLIENTTTYYGVFYVFANSESLLNYTLTAELEVIPQKVHKISEGKHTIPVDLSPSLIKMTDEVDNNLILRPGDMVSLTIDLSAILNFIADHHSLLVYSPLSFNVYNSITGNSMNLEIDRENDKRYIDYHNNGTENVELELVFWLEHLEGEFIFNDSSYIIIEVDIRQNVDDDDILYDLDNSTLFIIGSVIILIPVITIFIKRMYN